MLCFWHAFLQSLLVYTQSLRCSMQVNSLDHLVFVSPLAWNPNQYLFFLVWATRVGSTLRIDAEKGVSGSRKDAERFSLGHFVANFGLLLCRSREQRFCFVLKGNLRIHQFTLVTTWFFRIEYLPARNGSGSGKRKTRLCCLCTALSFREPITM